MNDKKFLTFWIPGNPIAKKRPRFARRGKFVMTYNDQQTEEGRFLLTLREQLPENFEPLTGPIQMSVSFCMKIPKSTSKKKAALMAGGDIKHIKKPDASNLLKFLEDCCNGEVWKDDSQIFSVIMSKFYGDRPHTSFDVLEI